MTQFLSRSTWTRLAYPQGICAPDFGNCWSSTCKTVLMELFERNITTTETDRQVRGQSSQELHKVKSYSLQFSTHSTSPFTRSRFVTFYHGTLCTGLQKQQALIGKYNTSRQQWSCKLCEMVCSVMIGFSTILTQIAQKYSSSIMFFDDDSLRGSYHEG